MDLTELSAFGALLVSIVSGWLAFRSTQVAHRAYQLAAKQAARLEAGIKVELFDYRASSTAVLGEQLYAFRIAVTNLADADTSIKTIDLAVECSRDGLPGSRFVLSLTPERTLPGTRDAEVLRLPLSLLGRATIAGVANFGIASELLQDGSVESYTLRVVDSLGNIAEREALFVNER